MTQDDLADATGMTKASISRLETGATKARVSTVRRLIAALSVESDQLTTTSEPTDGVSKGGEQR
jgi:predicted transcriptional regulator